MSSNYSTSHEHHHPGYVCVWSVTAFQDSPFLSFSTLHFEARIPIWAGLAGQHAPSNVSVSDSFPPHKTQHQSHKGAGTPCSASTGVFGIWIQDLVFARMLPPEPPLPPVLIIFALILHIGENEAIYGLQCFLNSWVLAAKRRFCRALAHFSRFFSSTLIPCPHYMDSTFQSSKLPRKKRRRWGRKRVKVWGHTPQAILFIKHLKRVQRFLSLSGNFIHACNAFWWGPTLFPSSRPLPIILKTFPSQLHVFFLLLFLNAHWVHLSLYVRGCQTIYSLIESLSGIISPKKTGFPSPRSYHLATAP